LNVDLGDDVGLGRGRVCPSDHEQD
jgi:hypothetical protein